MRGLGRAWQSTMMSMLVADRLAHRRDARLGVADRREPFERHRRRHRHRLERGEAAARPSPRASSAKRLRLVALVEVLHLPAAEVAVEAHVVAHRPAPELVARHAVHLAEDVPERDVDAADGRAADDAVAVPEVLAVHHLPQVLDPRRVLADDQLREVLDRADDGARVPLERRLAPAVEAGLVGEDLDEDPVAHPRVADVRFDRGDLHVPLLTRSSSATLSSTSVVDPAVADVRVRDPVRPAVAVLVEDVVQRDAGDEVEVVVGREVPGVVVRVAEDERLGERAARADLRAARVEELEGVRHDRDVAERERLELGPDGLVRAPDACRRRTRAPSAGT